MFIREVRSKKKTPKKYYSTYKLIESVRTSRGPRQRVVLNLGSQLNLPKEQWGDLAQRIEEIIRGIDILISYDSDLEKLAQDFAKQALKKQSQTVEKHQIEDHASENELKESDYETVAVNNLRYRDIREIGNEHLLYETARQLGFERAFKEVGFNKGEIGVALGSVIARAIYPGSERSTLERLQCKSGLGELLEMDFSSVSLNKMYKISDRLLSKKETLESVLYKNETHLFQIKETLVLYDLTNTYFEGSAKGNSRAKFGRSKEKRTDCPLVTLGLLLDESGFCKRSRIFDGNVSEPATLKLVIDGLMNEKQLTFSKPIVVLDAGIATEDNLKWLKAAEQQFDYIVVSRKNKTAFPEDEHAVIIKEDKNNQVKAVLKENSQTGEMELHCHSSAKAKKEKQMKTHFQIRFEQELKQLHEGLHKKGCTKKFDKVSEKLGRLKEKYKRIASFYKITIQRDKNNQYAKAVNYSLKKEKDDSNLAGNYCLRTSIKNFNEKKIWNIYTMLTEVEAAFRSMKSELGMRPVFHQKKGRVDGHLFITVLAYHLVHTIRHQLKKKGIHYSWSTIRKKMAEQARITVQLKRKDGKMIAIRKSSQPTPFIQSIYNAMGLTQDPGNLEKSIL